METTTLAMIKPDAVSAGKAGEILGKIAGAGFKIKALKMTQLTIDDAENFYAVHKGKPFYEKLVEFMTSGAIVVMLLQKENAVEDFRLFIGATDPAQAAEGTIRRLYATSVRENAIHASDSDENAAIETEFHFSKREIF